MASVQSFTDHAFQAGERSLAPEHGLGTPVKAGSVPVQRSVLGLRLSYLPDFLADQTLVGEGDAQRLAELLERHVQFVANLWKWQTAAFSLRYVYHPERGGIEVALLARILSRPESAQPAAGQLAADLVRLAQVYGLAAREVNDAAELSALRVPINGPHIVEVRQREDIVPFSWAHADAYVVYPYWQPAGAFLQPCEALLRQAAPCVINLHIEPTRLSPAEYQALASAAATAQTASDWQRSAHSVEYSGRWADPQAAAVARIYAAQLRRLAQPFVIAAQVASSDQFTAMSIAQALGAAFTARAPGAAADDDLVAGFDVVYPTGGEDAQAAARTLHHLILTPWGHSAAEGSPDLARLRYLADARGAAALFRFPIAVRSGVPGIEVRQPMPDFEPGARQAHARAGLVHLGNFQRGGAVTVRLRDLARHGLVAGLPGSGKTNTCLYVLSQLAEQGVPFLVIEPAKTEYRGLVRQPGGSDLLVFTLGDETTAPFRLNPFELLPGVRLEVHLEALNVAINAAMPQFGVLPSIIEEALESCYSARGWALTDRGPAGEPAAGEEQRLFPTLADFYRAAVEAVESRGYRGELHDNIQAAVKGRIGSLLRGSKGRMFNCRRSIDPGLLFDRPVVLELDSLGDEAKALTMMFLLILLREHRQAQARGAGELSAGFRHLLLIEEAHRVLENVGASSNPEVSADTRSRAVRAMTDFLVEMRAYGQGVLIAEQSPEKLAPDAVRNTNLKIGHMLPGRQDREALASAMIMDEAQERFMGKLRVGDAAVFMTGFEKASFMSVPNYKGDTGFADFLPDAVLRGHMQSFYDAHPLVLRPFDGCRFCGAACRHQDTVGPVSRRKDISQRFREALVAFDEHPEPVHWPAHWRAVARVCREAAGLAGRPGDPEAAYCYLAHEIDFPFTEHMRRAFVQAIEALPATG